MRSDLITSARRRRRLHASCSASPIPLAMTGVGQVAVPRHGRRLADQARRQGRRLAADRPGLQRERPALLPARPSRDRLQRRPRTVLQQPRARTARTLARPSPKHARRLPASASGPYDPGLTARATSRADAVTTSASGVDPHISQANARIQAHRVAARAPACRWPRARRSIDDNTDGRLLGLFGEPGVNVLELNLALDQEARRDDRPPRQRSLFAAAILLPALLDSAAQARPARTWSATR